MKDSKKNWKQNSRNGCIWVRVPWKASAGLGKLDSRLSVGFTYTDETLIKEVNTYDTTNPNNAGNVARGIQDKFQYF